jgi:hypothetical protein
MRKLLFIGFLFLAQSCHDGLDGLKEPDNLIPKNEMIELMTDMYILEAHIQNTYTTVNRFYKVMNASGRAYLKSKNITEKQYEDSYIYYSGTKEDFKFIIEKVQENLQRKSIEMQKKS